MKEESEKAGLKLKFLKTKFMTHGPITSRQIEGEKVEAVTDFFFSWAPNNCRQWLVAMKLKDSCSLERKLDKPKQCIKKQRHHFADKGWDSQSYGFSSSHVQMWELDHKEE